MFISNQYLSFAFNGASESRRSLCISMRARAYALAFDL
jgi:hypothetical protein